MASSLGATAAADPDPMAIIPCRKPPQRPPGSAYDSILTVIVTDNKTPHLQKKFPVFRGVLCFHSKLFRNALNGPFLESGSDVYEIKDFSIATFKMFYDWMNTGKTMGGGSAFATVELFAFADFYAIPDLKDHAIGLFLLYFAIEWSIRGSTIGEIYATTPENSAMRRLAIDIMAETCSFKNFRCLVAEADMTKEVVVDLVKALFKRPVDLETTIVDQLGGKVEWLCDFVERICIHYHYHAELEQESSASDSVINEHASEAMD